MKKLTLIGLCISLPFSAFAEHDFAYYKAMTVEMLPMLKINPEAVLFANVKKEPTLEMAVAHPKTIFIPTQILNTKQTEEALFECAVYAQISQLDFPAGTPSPVNPYVLSLAIAIATPITYSVPILFFKQSWTFNHWIETRERSIATGLLFGGLGLTLFLMMCYGRHLKVQTAGTQLGKIFMYLAVINQLLAHERTAPIAIAGMSLATQQYEQFAALAQHVSEEERAQLEKSYQIVSTRVQQWIAKHENEATATA